MAEYRIVDFAPGCEQEGLSHGLWPEIQGGRVRLDGMSPPDQVKNGHGVRAWLQCTCPMKDSSGDLHEHLSYFRPDELQGEE